LTVHINASRPSTLEAEISEESRELQLDIELPEE